MNCRHLMASDGLWVLTFRQHKPLDAFTVHPPPPPGQNSISSTSFCGQRARANDRKWRQCSAGTNCSANNVWQHHRNMRGTTTNLSGNNKPRQCVFVAPPLGRLLVGHTLPAECLSILCQPIISTGGPVFNNCVTINGRAIAVIAPPEPRRQRRGGRLASAEPLRPEVCRIVVAIRSAALIRFPPLRLLNVQPEDQVCQVNGAVSFQRNIPADQFWPPNQSRHPGLTHWPNHANPVTSRAPGAVNGGNLARIVFHSSNP